MAPPQPSRKGFTVGSDDDEVEERTPRSSRPQIGNRAPSTQRRDAGLKLPGFTSLAHGNQSEGQDDDATSPAWQPGSDPQTPNIAESAQQLRRSLSVHGLAELANMPPSQLRKSVGAKIWRPQDEQVRMPADWERLAVHVVRGGARSFNLAFMLRGSVMLVFALIRALRTKKAQGKAFLLAVFGAENIRFSLMFAAWTMLYKASSNALRLMTPFPQGVTDGRDGTKGGFGQGHERSQSAPAMENAAAAASEKAAGAPAPENEADISVDAQASGTATPRSGEHELAGKEGEERMRVKARQKRRAFMMDKRSKVWHAYVAGAISGLAILVERKDSRISLAQQLLVRGLEGTYNSAHARGKISIPHGAVITFGLACGQIMYAWLNQPHTLPRGYISWITQASHIVPTIPENHREIMAKQTTSTTLMEKLFGKEGIPSPIGTSSTGKPLYANIPPNKANRRGMTGKSVRDLINHLDFIKSGGSVQHVDCSAVHPWEHNHLWSPLDRFLEVTRWILPVYMTLHFVPAIFLRMRAFRKDPIRVFLRSLFGSIRSSSFLGVFVIIFQTIFCSCHQLYDYIQRDKRLRDMIPASVQRLLVGQQMHWGAGFLTSLSLFVEHQRRRTELAMYVLPKGMESAWSVARQRSWLPFVPGGDLLLTSAGMSLVMGTYAQSPEHLSGLVRRIVYQFVGRN